MRKFLLIAVILTLCAGCLSPEQLERLDILAGEIAATRLYAQRVAEEIKAGKVTPEEGAALVAEAVQHADALIAEARKIRAEGCPWWSVLIAGLSQAKGLPGPVGVVGTLAGIVYAILHSRKKQELAAVVKGVEAGRKVLGVDTDADTAMLKALSSAASDAGIGERVQNVVKSLTGDTH